jgi:transposase-like protein
MANLLKMAKIDAILSLHQRQWSIRRIAKELGIHRDTVARQIRLWEQDPKPARAPLGSAEEVTVCPEAKQATVPEGASASKQATCAEGASASKQATSE